MTLSVELSATVRDARIPFLNIRKFGIQSGSVKNYPYPYPICSHVLTAIHILSVSVLLTASPKKITQHIFSCSCNTGCPILIPLVVLGTDVDVAYFLMFATATDACFPPSRNVT